MNSRTRAPAAQAVPSDSARTVSCPACRGPAVYAASNPWRPFCSERCRQVDLGAWASEGYRVTASEPPEGDVPSGEPLH